MILDAVRRLLGFGDSTAAPSRQGNGSVPATRFDEVVPYREPMPPDISEFESEIVQVHKFMEQQMRSMMGSFGFTFGSPFSGFGDDSQFGSSLPFSHGIQDDPHPEISVDPTSASPALNPRDQVLKPQFRSRASGQRNIQDQVLDERLQHEDSGPVNDDLKSSSEVDERNNPIFDSFSSMLGHSLIGSGLFGNGQLGNVPGPDSGSVRSTSTFTMFSNVNGHKYVEKIIRHPDGTIERIVKSDTNPQEPL